MKPSIHETHTTSPEPTSTIQGSHSKQRETQSLLHQPQQVEATSSLVIRQSTNIHSVSIHPKDTPHLDQAPTTSHNTATIYSGEQTNTQSGVINKTQDCEATNQTIQEENGKPTVETPAITPSNPAAGESKPKRLFDKLPSLGPLNITNLEEFLNKAKQDFEVLYKEKITYDDINLSNFKLIKTLGTGSFGKVILAQSKDDSMLCAIKVMNKKEIIKWKQVRYVISEKRILQALNFPFTINLKCYFADYQSLYFVMPYVSGGDLNHLIRKQKLIKESHAQFYVGQLVLALEYLHCLGLIHRDIKPVNIVVDKLGYLKVADFGQCTRVVSSDKTWTMTGTPEYMAPEIIMHKGYDFAVDWWSLGVVTFEMCAGTRPFKSETVEKVYKLILRGKYHFPDHFSYRLKTFISKLLESSPARRVSKDPRERASKIKSSLWLKDTDWLALLNRTVPPPVPPILKDHTHDHVSTINKSVTKNLFTRYIDNHYY